ncbi:MAG: Maf family nucleotide pyrophosphatase [Crocinitomicaceae bacterium]
MLSQKLKDFKIILASQSPRRQELLKGLNIDFTALSKDVDETYPFDMPVEEIAEYLANKKGVAYGELHDENTIVITADTVVVVDDKVLEKPANEQEAADMLSQLSGRNHHVISGVCVKSCNRTESFSVATEVYFKKLNIQEIYHYVKEYKPYDKAGSYGIQEWIGYIGIQKIEGSYFNVMGLPVFELNQVLMNWPLKED